MKRNRPSKEKVKKKIHSLRRRGEPGSVVELSSVLIDKRVKEKPDAEWNEGTDDLSDDAAKLPTSEKELKKGFSSEGNHPQCVMSHSRSQS